MKRTAFSALLLLALLFGSAVYPAGATPARVRDAAGLVLVFPKRKEKTAESAEIAEQDDSLRAPRALR